MINLSKYNILELSYEIVPGEQKIDGTYTAPGALNVGLGRYIETQEIMSYNARMHWIHGQTHIGTHVEAPNKYDENGLDVARLPLEQLIGEAVACDFTHKKAREAITPEDFIKCGVKEGDIVLMWSNPDTWAESDQIFLTFECLDWLINEKKIKTIGAEKVRYSPHGTTWGPEAVLLAGAVLIDCLCGLSQIAKQRVFLIALPVKMQRVTAAWTRVIALEEK